MNSFAHTLNFTDTQTHTLLLTQRKRFQQFITIKFNFIAFQKLHMQQYNPHFFFKSILKYVLKIIINL